MGLKFSINRQIKLSKNIILDLISGTDYRLIINGISFDFKDRIDELYGIHNFLYDVDYVFIHGKFTTTSWIDDYYNSLEDVPTESNLNEAEEKREILLQDERRNALTTMSFIMWALMHQNDFLNLINDCNSIDKYICSQF